MLRNWNLMSEELKPAHDELSPAQPALEPEAERLLDEEAGDGDEEKEPEEVGEEAGGEKEHPADEDQGAVEQFSRRKAPLGKLRLDAAQDVEPLMAHQPGAGKADEEKNGHRRYCADEGTDLDEQVDLDYGDNEKEDEKPDEHVLPRNQ